MGTTFRLLIVATVAIHAAAVCYSPMARGDMFAMVGGPPGPIPNPDMMVRLAAKHVATLDTHGEFSRDDLPYLRFVHYVGIPEKRLAATRTVFGWWINNMSFNRQATLPRDVPDSNGRLQILDLRDFNWTSDAWSAVAFREPFTQEPWVFNRELGYLQKELGIHVPHDAGTKTFPAVAVVSAPWLLRETLESDRSTSYYDLLFARQRFGTGSGKTEKVKKTVTHPGGDFTYPDGRVAKAVAAGTYSVDVDQKIAAKDFPKNVKEWDEAFGIDIVRAFARKERVQLEYGAVVEGGADNPKTGSMVALHNRLLVTINAPAGAAMRSFDVFDSAARKNYLETAVFLPGYSADGTVEFDAGELLAYLPNGGQAAFLIDGKGNRQEIAANKAASAQMIDKRLNPGVRNPGDCVICHAPSNGYNVPSNIVEELKDKGFDTKIRDKNTFNQFLAFYFDWSRNIPGWTQPYQNLLTLTTRRASVAELVKAKLDGKKIEGWTGAKMATEVQSFRDWYDEPLTIEQAAAEVGCPKEILLQVVTRSTSAGLNAFHFGRPIPRRTWELESYREAALQLAAARQP